MASGALAFLGELPDGSWVMSQGVVKINLPQSANFPRARQFVTGENKKFGGGGVEFIWCFFPQPEGHTTLYCPLKVQHNNGHHFFQENYESWIVDGHGRLLVGLISHKAEPKKSEQGCLVRNELTTWVLDCRHLDQRNPQIAETIFSRGGNCRNTKIFQNVTGSLINLSENQPVTTWKILGCHGIPTILDKSQDVSIFGPLDLPKISPEKI